MLYTVLHADASLAGLSTADSFKFNLGQYAIGFVGTCASWITMTVSASSSSSDATDTGYVSDNNSTLVVERSI